MAITNVELKASFGGAPGQPTFTDIVEIDLDNAYATGGYTGFAAILQAVIGAGREILNVEQNNFPTAHIVKYDRTNDTLVVYTEALVEAVNATDLSLAADLELLVTSK